MAGPLYSLANALQRAANPRPLKPIPTLPYFPVQKPNPLPIIKASIARKPSVPAVKKTNKPPQRSGLQPSASGDSIASVPAGAGLAPSFTGTYLDASFSGSVNSSTLAQKLVAAETKSALSEPIVQEIGRAAANGIKEGLRNAPRKMIDNVASGFSSASSRTSNFGQIGAKSYPSYKYFNKVPKPKIFTKSAKPPPQLQGGRRTRSKRRRRSTRRR